MLSSSLKPKMKSNLCASSLLHGVNYSSCGLSHEKKKQKERHEKNLSKLSNVPSTRRYPSRISLSIVDHPDSADETTNADKANIVTPMVTEEEKATKSKEEIPWNTETAISNFFLDYEEDVCDEYDKDNYPMHGLSVCISDDGAKVDVFNRKTHKQDKRI